MLAFFIWTCCTVEILVSTIKLSYAMYLNSLNIRNCVILVHLNVGGKVTSLGFFPFKYLIYYCAIIANTYYIIFSWIMVWSLTYFNWSWTMPFIKDISTIQFKSQDGQHNKMAIRRRTSNDLQNTTQKTKD
jgi:hypothetical protein